MTINVEVGDLLEIDDMEGFYRVYLVEGSKIYIFLGSKRCFCWGEDIKAVYRKVEATL